MMRSSDKPELISVPFAENGDTNKIPINATQEVVENGLASYERGFPPLTMTPISAGGIPPSGQDMNGILRDITYALRYSMSGGLYVWDSAFCESVGGYPAGAILISSDNKKLWWNTVENNKGDPDKGGAGWVNLLSDPNGLFLQKEKNLSDLINKATSRDNLGLGSISIQDASNVEITGGKATFNGINVTGLSKFNASEIQSSYHNAFRIAYGSYGVLWRSDGSTLYILCTDKEDAYGPYNDLRPFRINLASGELTLGKTALSDYYYFDKRYYTKVLSD